MTQLTNLIEKDRTVMNDTCNTHSLEPLGGEYTSIFLNHFYQHYKTTVYMYNQHNMFFLEPELTGKSHSRVLTHNGASNFHNIILDYSLKVRLMLGFPSDEKTRDPLCLMTFTRANVFMTNKNADGGSAYWNADTTLRSAMKGSTNNLLNYIDNYIENSLPNNHRERHPNWHESVVTSLNSSI